MSEIYIVASTILAILVLFGIKLMSSPKTAVRGNRLSAISMLVAVILVLGANDIIQLPLLWIAIILGSMIGYALALKVPMIKMPQMVALYNGLGGAASALVALVEILEATSQQNYFVLFTSRLALIIGGITFSGSIIAAAKLDKRISQRPAVLPHHKIISNMMIIVLILLLILSFSLNNSLVVFIILIVALTFGVLFAMRIGGADMPIIISLLNSLSGLAAAICGFTVFEPLLVSVGAIVGASGLILTNNMCVAMNRSLSNVLTGGTTMCASKFSSNSKDEVRMEEKAETETKKSPAEILKRAKKVIIVPGYGMAVSQAQFYVKNLTEVLEKSGTEVKFAIHPVAGRMPGHMNVLLAEADIPYEKLCEMDDINDQFAETDVAIVIGACDVTNPAANTAEGTPIYGMPVLKTGEAKNVIVCNLDTNPGYSGVENSLYTMPNVQLILGNAADTIKELINNLEG
ncbi:MAG: NAD(P)(+) transhydrogenase (Re/Si-specific) subunit beta [Clostridia bacterium]|nr:NAD(P)(+) transhydrogenase (Re/Si-specific) subunit beta [Clostridia bacterium]